MATAISRHRLQPPVLRFGLRGAEGSGGCRVDEFVVDGEFEGEAESVLGWGWLRADASPCARAHHLPVGVGERAPERPQAATQGALVTSVFCGRCCALRPVGHVHYDRGEVGWP